MDVKLAGFNVDTNVLREMEEITGERDDMTPEVLSASYARISRDSRSIGKIRISSKEEVEKARRSNSSIIFKMGHHSVAEHAVFNLDIVGLSRYAVEELEKFRLCSYTEKSQRYITLSNDFVVPPEIVGTKFEQKFRDTVRYQNDAYGYFLIKLIKHALKKNPKLADDPKNLGLLEGWAKEDARYLVSIATEAQVGVTVNARNLELMLRRFASNPLQEVQELGRKIYREVKDIAPSIILFHDPNDYDSNTYPRLRELGIELFKGHHVSALNTPVSLIDYTRDADDIIATALLYKGLVFCYSDITLCVEDLTDRGLTDLYKAAWKDAQLYDSMPREFEYVNLTYELTLSSSCFAQLKRHRMSSIIAQPYNPSLDVTIPNSIIEMGEEKEFRKVIDKTNEVFSEIHKELPLVAPYILTNAHKRRVLMRVNARELYHMSRMREDKHAQWDIRNLVTLMCNQAQDKMPYIFALLCGKDSYNEVYKDVFGEEPRVKEVKLPTMRKIKKDK